MKTRVATLAFLALGIICTYIKFNVIWTGEKIELKEIGTIQLDSGSVPRDIFNDEDWIIITGEEKRLNWVESGYQLPVVDFEKTFLLLSNQKIKALYKERGCDECTGFQMDSHFMTFSTRKTGRTTFMRCRQSLYPRELVETESKKDAHFRYPINSSKELPALHRSTVGTSN